jgi:CheY-like chemotaxis protein
MDPCPYCGAPLRWIPLRWFGRGTFACERCGEFPDFRSQRDQAAGDAPAASLETPHAPPAAAPEPIDDRPRVLMIDDSTAERELYALMLERDVRVLTAARGADGLALAERERVDAIVLDVMMPEMNGWEVCDRLKANPRTAAIPVIMLTGQDAAGLAAEALRHGAATLLTKPCPAERLTAVLSETLGSRRA